MSAVSIDVDFLDNGPVRTALRYADKQKALRGYVQKFNAFFRNHTGLIVELENLDLDLRFNFEDGCVDMTFAGDGDKFRVVWAALRRARFEPTSRPAKGASSFATFFEFPLSSEYPRIWFSFSSTVCRRVKVGTRMVEQDVFETHCDALPEIETEQTAQELLA